MSTTRSEDISALARQLWQDAGRPPGRDLEFWLKAESHIQSLVSKLESQEGLAETTNLPASSRNARRRERPGHSVRAGSKKGAH